MKFKYYFPLIFLSNFLLLKPIFAPISEEDKNVIFQLGQLVQCSLDRYNFAVNHKLLSDIWAKSYLSLEHRCGLEIGVKLESLLVNLVDKKKDKFAFEFFLSIDQILKSFSLFVENFEAAQEDILVLWIRVLDKMITFVVLDDPPQLDAFYDFMQSFIEESGLVIQLQIDCFEV